MVHGCMAWAAAAAAAAARALPVLLWLDDRLSMQHLALPWQPTWSRARCWAVQPARNKAMLDLTKGIFSSTELLVWNSGVDPEFFMDLQIY